MAPKVSIIVPLAGGPAQALRCFEGIAVQPDDPAHEIIVVDDASVGLEPLLSQLAGDVEVLRNERRLGLARSARRGAEHARGEIIVFIRDAAAPAARMARAARRRARRSGRGFAASATVDADDPGAPHSPVAAWSFAVRTADFRATDSGSPSSPACPAARRRSPVTFSGRARSARGHRRRAAACPRRARAPVAPAAPPASTPS